MDRNTYNGYLEPITFWPNGLRGMVPLFKSPHKLCDVAYGDFISMSIQSVSTWTYGGGRTFGGSAFGDSTKA